MSDKSDVDSAEAARSGSQRVRSLMMITRKCSYDHDCEDHAGQSNVL